MARDAVFVLNKNDNVIHFVVFGKARQKSDRIGSERRLPTFLCQTFRNSENPRTHKDVFHLGLSL